jgi:hypothetical protein
MSNTREFLFENSNGIRYRVRLNLNAATGLARKVNGTNSRGDGPVVNGGGVTLTPVSFTIDAGDLATVKTCNVSRLCYGAFYNTNLALDTVLNAAS